MLASSGEKNSFCHLKRRGGIVRCRLLGLILPKGKEPFHPLCALGLPSAWQRTPAPTGVWGAAFAVRSPSCRPRLTRCLPPHLRQPSALSCPAASRQPPFKAVRKRNETSLSTTHDCFTVQGAMMFSFTPVNDTGRNARRRGREGFLLTGPDSGPGRGGGGGHLYRDLFSNHPCLYKTQAPISHDPAS